MSVLLIAGLGNPGPKYISTRHNAGFIVLDALLEEFNVSFTDKVSGKSEYQIAETRNGMDRVLLVKPMTFMNRSGDAIWPLMRFHKIIPENLIVVHDDLDIEPGRLKFVSGGGAGGHNGIKSIISSIGTKEFHRLKIGIGRPEGQIPVDRYVLSNFKNDEKTGLENAIKNGVACLKIWMSEGIEKAMCNCNKRM